MTIKIHNVRAGFATNSSSSHSVVLIPDDMIGKIRENSEIGYSYGWDNFTLVSQENKLRYLAANLLMQAYADRPEQINKIFSPYFNEEEIRELQENGVDHQSVFSINLMSEGFTNYLIKIFSSPNVIVLGGNDNDGEHSLSAKFPEHPLIKTIPVDGGGMYSVNMRFDGDFISIFDRRAGTKIRISVNDDVNTGTLESSNDYVKSTYPELIDLKITDFCTKGCNFCYQSSTDHGTHGSMTVIKDAIELMKRMEVFEVAIGGGEPTTHPHFMEIIESIHNTGMVPNFTTMNDEWLNNAALVSSIERCVGGIGVSCHSAKDLILLEKIKAAFTKYSRVKIMAQHVFGSMPLEVTGDFLNKAFSQNIPVLLLGYKEIGFGKGFNRFDHGDVALFMKLAVERYENVSLSVDTALVDQHPEIISAVGAIEAQVSSPEGKFSCYIDTVDGLIGASSYVEKSEMVPFTNDLDKFAEIYKAF